MSDSKRAFDFSRGNMWTADPNELVIIGGAILGDTERGPHDTADGPEHMLYDRRIEKPLDEAFILNIDAHGVLEPVLVTKINDRPVIVAGRRRVRGARAANQRRAQRGEPLIKVEFKMARQKGNGLLGAMRSENEAREDDSPLAKLENIKEMLARGVSQEDVAVNFCLSPEYVAQLLNFDNVATDEVKAALQSGRMSLRAAAELARVKDPDKQRAALASYTEIVAAGDTTRGKRVGTLRAAQAARAQAEGKPAPKGAGKAEKPAKGTQGASGAKPAAPSGKPAPTSQGGLIPTRRELSALLRELAERTDVENEAAVFLDDARAGEKKPTIKGKQIDLSHVEGAWAIGVAEGLKLAMGKCEDKELLKLLAKAVRA